MSKKLKILSNPKPNTQFYCLNNQLALYHKKNSHADYWENYWDSLGTEKLFKSASKGKLGEFENYGLKHLSKTDRILEAGCGPGWIVYGLNQLGYNLTEGVDYDNKIVETVKNKYPHTNIKVGNLLNLDYQDNYFDVYLSFGVIEHFFNGPEELLIEAKRVTKKNGIIMISVPHLNMHRASHLNSCEKISQDNQKGLFFHQYYFDENRLQKLLQKHNFELINYEYYAMQAFLCREKLSFIKYWDSFLLRNPLRRLFKYWMYYNKSQSRRNNSHMIMAICKNRK